jgi:hypothetical protein
MTLLSLLIRRLVDPAYYTLGIDAASCRTQSKSIAFEVFIEIQVVIHSSLLDHFLPISMRTELIDIRNPPRISLAAFCFLLQHHGEHFDWWIQAESLGAVPPLQTWDADAGAVLGAQVEVAQDFLV